MSYAKKKKELATKFKVGQEIRAKQMPKRVGNDMKNK